MWLFLHPRIPSLERREVRHLCKDGGVLGLHHRVDDGLRVNDNLDVIIGGAVQVVRLNDLQALVHERRAVAGDLGSHAAETLITLTTLNALRMHNIAPS